MGIRNKISLSVSLLFGILLSAAAALFVNLGEEKIRETISTQQVALVNTLAYGFDQQVFARHRALISIAEGLSPSLLSQPTRLQNFLQTQIVLPKLFTNVLVYDPQGKVIGAYPSPEKYVGTMRLAKMEYVAETITSRQPYISKLFISPVSGEPLIVMTAPVFDKDGKLLAILGGSQYVLRDNLFSGLTETNIGKTGNMVLITRDRLIIAHPDKSRLMTKIPAGVNIAVDHALKEGSFTGEAVTSTGIPAIMTIQTMQSTGWLAGAFLPQEEAYAPVGEMWRHAIQVVVLLLLILPALVWMAMGILTRPLLALRDQIMNMTTAPQKVTLMALNRDDEIGELAQAFDQLTLARQVAETDQLRLNRALRLLSDCNQTLIHAEEEQQLLNNICALILRSGGYPFAWVGFVDAANQRLKPVAQAGTGTDYLAAQDLSLVDGVCNTNLSCSAVCDGTTIVSQAVPNAPISTSLSSWKHSAIAHGFNASIALPLKNESGIFGVLTIHATDADAFTPEEVTLLEELAADLTFGIETLRARLARISAEGDLAFLAHHDPLTKLPNRLLLRDRFEQAIASADREQSRVGMLFLDLDNFKEINDSLGHGIGDELLIAVVQRLQNTIRQADTISREGGDEFVVLLTGITSISNISRVAQSILDSMVNAFQISDHTLHTSFSIGISVYPNDGTDFDTVRKNADTALYRAKDSGRRNYRFFAGQMNIDAQARMQMQIDLRKALQNNEFRLHYQPQVRLSDHHVIGVEALVRWQNGDTLVPPGQFIPVAEHSGLIIPIGEWVLNEACRQTVIWHKAGYADLVVAVNLSALQFKHGSIIDTVALALEHSGLAPEYLELELTESVLLQDVEVAMGIIHNLHELGVKLSIDDFGTGYSSLSYLKRLAVDKLKVDQSFVRDIVDDTDDAAIVRAVIQLGHTLQLEVIAEGVETPAQLAFLKASQCDEAQGYLFSRPVTAAEVPALISSIKALPV